MTSQKQKSPWEFPTAIRRPRADARVVSDGRPGFMIFRKRHRAKRAARASQMQKQNQAMVTTVPWRTKSKTSADDFAAPRKRWEHLCSQAHSFARFQNRNYPAFASRACEGQIAVQDRKVWEDRVRAEHLCERVHCDDAPASSERIASF
jgi:hypothetical protein